MSKPLYIKAVLLAYLLFAQISVYSQQFHFTNYSVDNGLPQSQVNDMVEDSRGYMWFATAGGGICKFDGINFTTYDEKDGLAGKIVNCIAEDNFGNIWAGSTWGGVTKYDGNTFSTFENFNKEVPSPITALASDKKGDMWIGSDAGLYIYNGRGFNKITDIKSLSDAQIRTIYCDKAGNMWIGTNKGIIKYSSNFTVIDKGLPHENIRCIFEDSKGNMWFGTDGYGAFNITSESIKRKVLPKIVPFSTKKEYQDIIVTDISEDNDGNIWIATYNIGLLKKAKDGSIKKYGEEEGLSSNYIFSLAKDRTGGLWAGTNGSGVNLLRNEIFEHYFSLPSVHGYFFSINEDTAGNIWAGTSNNGVFVFDQKKKTTKHYNKNNLLPGNEVRDIEVLQDGRILLANNAGLCEWNNGTFKTYNKQTGQPFDGIKTIYQSSDGTVWLGTYGKGLVKMQNDTFSVVKSNQLQKWAHSIIEGDDGTMYFGTENGLVKYKNGKYTRIGVKDGLCNSYIGCMAKDKYGNIWMGSDRCIMKYDGTNLSVFNEKDGLTSSTIYLLQIDDSSNLWVGTNKGLDKIKLGEAGEIKDITFYGKTEGFLGVECNTKATYKDAEGNIWFGTIKGLTKYYPKRNSVNLTPPSLHITNVDLFFSKINWRNYSNKTTEWNGLPINAELPHHNNHLTFSFIGINQNAPKKVKYQFMVEGFDEDWQPKTYKTEVNYFLPPGKYTFKVKAANENGIWSETKKFSFTILKPYWQQWWFYLICIVLGLLLIYIFILLRTRSLASSTKKLEKEVKSRVAEIKKQSEEKDVLIKEIHHRVKNNLQVINSLLNLQSAFIKDEEALTAFKECQNRVASMALIHEKLYQSKNLSKVSVREYITSLLNNITTTYTIDKHISVDVEITDKKLYIDTLIPLGLLLNELVSNSFKYGFTDTEAGKITVKLEQTGNGTYKMLVGDNGVGMPKNIMTEPAKTLGIELVQILVGQLNGTIERTDQKGTYFRINFTDISSSTI